MGCHFLLQGIFPTRGSNPGLPHYTQMLYRPSYQGSPAEERREAKGKGERERYTQLNAEFQITVKRDKKTFFSEQCKGIEENNREIKTSELVKKIRDIKGTFHARIGTIKDRNGKDLTETGEIKKRWQEYTEELYKTDLNDLDNHDDVIIHLEPDTGVWS